MGGEGGWRRAIRSTVHMIHFDKYLVLCDHEPHELTKISGNAETEKNLFVSYKAPRLSIAFYLVYSIPAVLFDTLLTPRMHAMGKPVGSSLTRSLA